MKQWLPVPVEVIENIDNDRRLIDTPASTLDGFAYAWLKSHRGAPLSQRQLARWAGWSKRKASAVLDAVQDAQNDWADQKRTKSAPPVATQNGPAEVNNGARLHDSADHKRTTNGPVSDQKRTDRFFYLYRYKKKLTTLGKLVEYPEGRGWAKDVDIDGSLIIETPEGKMINLSSPLITEAK